MKYLLAVAAILACIPCQAHQDRVLKLGPDGQLEGLPPQYTPSSLRVTFSPKGSDSPPVAKLELKVGDKTTVVPTCVTGLILTRSEKDVLVTASWYHERSTLPHYLNVVLRDPGREGEMY